MPYCPGCGSEVDQAVILPSPVAETVSAEVEIARIQAERDIKVAQITARQERDWNDTRVEVAEVEAGAEVEAAPAEAEIIGAALEASETPDAEPIEIIAPEAITEDDEPDDAPPPAEGSPVPESIKRKSAGIGFW